MRKMCVCGKSIKYNSSLCHECQQIYGIKVSEWPEWLKWLVADVKREWDHERYRDDLPYDDLTDFVEAYV
ncbi:hypothetical protein DRH14_04735 [Candidatus Shapirobacteria bacterium]|nr:MAG: hypothetical protein DRH14_04735 [Candidatus Shapirobacteria bacterium]